MVNNDQTLERLKSFTRRLQLDPDFPTLADPFMQSIWNEAYSSIIDAEKIIFIGYSIPKEDLQARSLISIGWSTRKRVNKLKRDNYLLIDPNPDVLGRYCSIVSNDVDYYQTYFNNEVLPYIFKNKRNSI